MSDKPGEEAAEDDATLVDIRLYLTKQNHDRLWSAVAKTGDNFADVVNRAIAMYERLHSAPRGTTLRWTDRDGEQYEIFMVKAGGKGPATDATG